MADSYVLDGGIVVGRHALCWHAFDVCGDWYFCFPHWFFGSRHLGGLSHRLGMDQIKST